MKHDARYAAWLNVADELEAFRLFLYEKSGYWHQPSEGYQVDQFLRSAKWLRRRCAKGWWYWWDRGWFGGVASEPLHTLYRFIGDAGGEYESNPEGRAVIARADALQLRIDRLSKGDVLSK